MDQKPIARAVAVVACVTLLCTGGCAKRSHGLIIAGVGLAATVATGVAIDRCKDEGCSGGVILLLVPSVGTLIGGILGAATARPGERPMVIPIVATPDLEDSEPDQALGLAERARFAARSGQCDSVARLAPRIERADPAYYKSEVLTDPAIARCLEATRAPPTATPPVVTPPAGTTPPVVTPPV